MKLIFSGTRDLQRDALYRLIFRGLLGGYTPILLTGDRSFDFYGFLRARKRARIPLSLVDKMRFACAVNGHHIRPLIQRTVGIASSTSFVIFLDFTRHYLDDTVPEQVRRFMFRRDLSELQSLEHPFRPVFFFEGGNSYPDTIQEDLRGFLYSAGKIHLEARGVNFLPRKFGLNPVEQKAFFEGGESSSLSYLCEKLAEKWKVSYDRGKLLQQERNRRV